MRTLGPGSVSSLLKSVLEVVFIGLWVGLIGAVVAGGAASLCSSNAAALSHLVRAQLEEVGQTPALVEGELFAAAAYIAGVLLIVGQLRRVFASLTAGDPFHPDNVRRLRRVGLILAVLELGRYPWSVVEFWLSPTHATNSMSVNLTAWFAVLVVFVLAEVFREGARLRQDAELTI